MSRGCENPAHGHCLSHCANCDGAELDALRRLVHGGPCPTCKSTGKVRNPAEMARVHINTVSWSSCPDCDGTGHTPGLIERLETAGATLRAVDGRFVVAGMLDAILADLRQVRS